MTIRLVIGIFIGAGIGALIGHFGKCTSGMCPLTANPFRGAIVGAVLGALISYGGTRRESAREGPEPANEVIISSEQTKAKLEPKKEDLIHVNSETDFKKYVLNANLPCLADFFSDSCPPCRMLAPTIEKLANKYKGKAVVCKVSLDHADARGLARKYKIRGIPAVIFFSDGRETQRLVGLRSEKAYSRVLDEMIKKESKEEVKED